MTLMMRGFTPVGREDATEYLRRLVINPTEVMPSGLLTSDATTVILCDVGVNENPEIINYWQLGAEVDRIIKAASAKSGRPEKSFATKEFFNWLSFLWFDRLCQTQPDGSRRLSKSDKNKSENAFTPFLFDLSFQRRYRHRVATAYFFVSAFVGMHEDIEPLLRLPVTKQLSAIDETLSRQGLSTNRSSLAAVCLLFSHVVKGERIFRKGVFSGGSKKTPGGLRDFSIRLKEFGETYFLNGMTPAEILALMPAQFAGSIANLDKKTKTEIAEAKKVLETRAKAEVA